MVRAYAALLLAAMISLLPVSYVAAQSFIGSAEIHAPAVIVSNNTGVLTLIKLTVTSGNGNVNITGPSEVGSSTIDSAITAAKYASSLLGLNFNNYNFNYSILNSDAINVSGPSAGAAMTILAVSALSGRPLPSNFTMTGTINSNGSIGLIGGVYDKAGAAKSNGMDFVLVPAVPSNSNEDMLYTLTQDEFGIPLVQVANISQAAQYALYHESISGHASSFTPFVDYNVSLLPNAGIECSNGCNESQFGALAAFTYNLTQSSINGLKAYPGFSNVTQQLQLILDQAETMGVKGYYYMGADQSFLDYITSYYFNQHNATKSSGIATLDSISNSCSSLVPPQLTSTNYEYVIGGELRQAWANYTISQDIGIYNATAIDTDGVLQSLYSGAEAQGWCEAASYMYNVSASIGGTPVTPNSALRGIAQSDISNAQQYGSNFYLTTAQSAFRAGNYPLAILDSEYAYAFSNATASFGDGTGMLLNMTTRLADNSTFGAWASQFANEAMFYVGEALMSGNSTEAHGYATTAYSTALLANGVSNDTMLINKNLVAAPPQAAGNYDSEFSSMLTALAGIEKAMLAIFIVLVGILVAIIATFIALLVLINKKVSADGTYDAKKAASRRR